MNKVHPAIIHIFVLVLLLFGNITVYIMLPSALYLHVFSSNNFISEIPLTVFVVVASLFALFGNAMLSLAIIWHWGSRCRTITITNQGICRGRIRPACIRWADVSTWGIATVFPKKTNTLMVPTGKRHVYIVSGSVSDDEIRKYGISQIWTWSCVKKNMPLLVPVLEWMERHGKATEKNQVNTGNQLVLPDQIIWVKYSPELYRIIKTYIERAKG